MIANMMTSARILFFANLVARPSDTYSMIGTSLLRGR